VTNARVPTQVPLRDSELDEYATTGLLFKPAWLEPSLVEAVRTAGEKHVDRDEPGRVLERDGTTVRSVYGVHRDDLDIQRMCRHPLVVAAVRQLLGGDVYIHQFKVNAKRRFDGDVWDWHQDFVYWRKDDLIPEPRLVNCVVFLDEVTEFNGPLYLIPRSHRSEVAHLELDATPAGYEEAPAWVANLTATERYGIERAVVETLARRYGLVAPKGPPGSVLFFHPEVLHASPPNVSPFDRTLAITVYNRTDNAPRPTTAARPEFLAARSCVEPLEPLGTE
jgi:ectoine hydroxylase